MHWLWQPNRQLRYLHCGVVIQRLLVEKLPDKQRTVFIESFLHEKKQQEVANELNVSVKTVSRYQLQIIEKLREELKDYLPSLALFSILISGLK